MSRDPLGYSEGVNLYAYVGNNPTTFTDPWGLSIKPLCSRDDQPVVTINEGKPEQFLPPTVAQNIWNNSVVQTLLTEDLENFYVNCFAQEQVCLGRCDKTECVVSVISTINPASKATKSGIKGVNIIKNWSDNVAKAISKNADDVLKNIKWSKVPKPNVDDPVLQKAMNDIYASHGNTIGNGSLADAVRNELATGKPTYGKFHSIEGQQQINRLEKRLYGIGSYQGSSKDVNAVKLVIADISNALNGK